MIPEYITIEGFRDAGILKIDCIPVNDDNVKYFMEGNMLERISLSWVISREILRKYIKFHDDYEYQRNMIAKFANEIIVQIVADCEFRVKLRFRDYLNDMMYSHKHTGTGIGKYVVRLPFEEHIGI